MNEYYSIETPVGKSDALERAFSQLEGDAAPLVALLGDAPGPTFSVSDSERATLAQYFALLSTRSPASRFGSEQMYESLHAMQLWFHLRYRDGWHAWRRKQGDVRSEEEIEAERTRLIVQLEEGDVTITADEAVSLPTVLSGMEAIWPYIAQMNWTLLKRDEYPWFPIGDNPVTMWANPSHPDELGVGFASIDAEMSVPIDGSTMLIGAHKGLDGYVINEHDLERRIGMHQVPWSYHYRQWARAKRFVYATSHADLQAIELMLPPARRHESFYGLDTSSHPWAASTSRGRVTRSPE